MKLELASTCCSGIFLTGSLLGGEHYQHHPLELLDWCLLFSCYPFKKYLFMYFFVAVLPCFYTFTMEELFTREVSVDSSRHLKDSDQEETWENEDYEYDITWNADRTYLKFKKAIDTFPEQCFRYLSSGKLS